MYQYVKLHNSQAFFLLFQHVREFSNIGAWKVHCLRKHLRHSIVLDRKWTHVYQNGRQTFKARKLLLPSVLSIPIVMSVLSTLFCFIAELHILWPFWKGLFCPFLVAHAQLSVHFPLLFVQILVQATKSSHDIAIYVDDSRKLDCRESLDYVRSNPANPFLYSKGKTCSVSGVFYLAQGSELTIRILTSHTAVILKPENTNFGAILLKT